LFLGDRFLTTSNTTSTSGSNKTDLLTRGSISSDGRSVTNVLMVTTSVRMVNRVHCHTTHSGPAVPLYFVLVIGVTGLQHGLIDPTTTGNNTNHGTSVRREHLLGARWQFDAALTLIGVVIDECGVVSRSTGIGSTITDLAFNVANDGTLRHGSQRKNVTNGKLGLLAAVHKLTRVHALSGNEQLLLQSVFVGISELNLGEGSTTSGVVHNAFDNTLDVTLALSKVKRTVLSRSLSGGYVGLEDTSLTLSLT